MAGSFIRYDNETILTDDEVILLPNDLTLPSAEAILPSGLLMSYFSKRQGVNFKLGFDLQETFDYEGDPTDWFELKRASWY